MTLAQRSSNMVLVTDETNREPSEESKFFIYGGCVFPLDYAHEIHASISEIRQNFGYSAEDRLKFDIRSKPGHLSKEDFKAAKSSVIELAASHGATLVVNLVLHDIAKNKSFDERVLMALRALCCQFDMFLEENSATGQIIVDRGDGLIGVLQDLRTRGVDPQAEGWETHRDLDRIWQFSVGAMNTGHLMSVVDIVIGALRYCVNNPAHDVSVEMFRQIIPLFSKAPTAEDFTRETGILIRPKDVRNPIFRKCYMDLRRDIAALAAAATAVPVLADDDVPF